MATEAQRLIGVSIGKIAMSRTHRGGINLHKNLLVASVLHKARTAYMLENIQLRLVNKISQTNASPGVESNSQSVSHSKSKEHMVVNENPGKRSGAASECRNISEACPSADKENSPPNNAVRMEIKCNNVNDNNGSFSGPCVESMDITNSNCMNKNDKSPISKSDKDSTTNNGVRCYKRRSSGPLEVCLILPKKPRLDCDTENESEFTETESCSRNSIEKMQTESPQISNLVTIFNTGFSGLCVTVDDHSLARKQYTGRYDNSLSCANEAKDNALDKVSISTVIALTV